MVNLFFLSFFVMKVLQPSKELEGLLHRGNEQDGLSTAAISDICKVFDLKTNDVQKYRNSM